MCLIMKKLNTYYIFLIILQSPSNNGDKIVGGEYTENDSDYPFAAAIESDGRICSGSIISEFFVLSACHCVADCSDEEFPKLYDVGSYRILTGSSDRDKSRPFSKRVSHMFCSPKARPVMVDGYFLIQNDEAGLKVSQQFKWSLSVGPIALEFNNETMLKNQLIEYAREGTKCIALGWGSTFLKCCFKVDYIVPSRYLKQLEVKLIEKCDSYFNIPLFEYNQMCAISATSLSDVCAGDSGGPLICNGHYYGMTSWGTHCGEVPVPSVYQIIDIDFYTQIINETFTSRAKQMPFSTLYFHYLFIIQLFLIIKYSY